MSRFGVMKHLKQLEEAGLVVTRRSGREKHHFLNPVPIRLVHDRWVSKYAEPWVTALSDLKERMERDMEKVFEIYIRTTPERLWQAIVDPEIRSKYNFGAGVRSDWTPGSRLEMGAPQANGLLGEGEVLEVDPPRRLVHTMVALWSDEVRDGGCLEGHLGDRAHRRFVPAHRRPRSAARGRQRSALRWLAHDPLRPQDLARERRAAHHARVADVRLTGSTDPVRWSRPARRLPAWCPAPRARRRPCSGCRPLPTRPGRSRLRGRWPT